MKIVFMSGGAREKALKYLLEKKENVVAVITPYLSDKNRRFENVILTAAEYGIPIFSVDKNNVESTLEKIDFDTLISCGFSYILSEKIISKAKHAINVHPTLLPQYRGFRSGPYIIINDEKQSGVTIHFITGEMDKGDILLQQAFELSKFDTTKSVYKKVQELEQGLLYKAIQMLKTGQFKTLPQNENKASVYNYIRTPKDSEIDWNKPLKALYNEIRACDPNDYPAFFYVEGQKVCIKLWRPDKLKDEEDMI
ncbi:MAG: methionyl-tRNA formyltransferase [Deltaproteobacteria bacterium]